MSAFKKVLVIGSRGQLGCSIIEKAKDLVEKKQLDLITADIQEIDISLKNKAEEYISRVKADLVINCAAYTAVDKAEEEEASAFLVNHTGVLNLAEVCKSRQIPLIHISTDYVFPGNVRTALKEDMKTGPLTVYGKSKLAGEQALIDSGVKGIIIRTSWLYSEYGGNFVKSMIRLGKEKHELGVVNDQTGSPTYAGDLAEAIISIIKGYEAPYIFGDQVDVYHYSNTGSCTWFDLAARVMKINNINCTVFPISTREYPTPAKRPEYTVLNTDKIRLKFNLTIPAWERSLEVCINKINKINKI